MARNAGYKNSDTGTGWVQRWIANPLVSGSIPARVSKSKRRFLYGIGRRFGAVVVRKGQRLQSPFWGGVFQEIVCAQYNRGSYRSPSYRKMERLLFDHHAGRVKAETALSETREKLIDAQKQLSRIKRGQ